MTEREELIEQIAELTARKSRLARKALLIKATNSRSALTCRRARAGLSDARIWGKMK